MIRSETFSCRYICDKEVARQIADYCNLHGITKDMIILCKIDHATDGTVRENGYLVYDDGDVQNG